MSENSGHYSVLYANYLGQARESKMDSGLFGFGHRFSGDPVWQQMDHDRLRCMPRFNRCLLPTMAPQTSDPDTTIKSS
jgi:hypothetical protein